MKRAEIGPNNFNNDYVKDRGDGLLSSRDHETLLHFSAI